MVEMLRQITKDNTLHLSPSWSPDGRYIVYTSYKSGDPDLYKYDLKTGKETRNYAGYRGIDSGGQFDVDGKTVVFLVQKMVIQIFTQLMPKVVKES